MEVVEEGGREVSPQLPEKKVLEELLSLSAERFIDGPRKKGLSELLLGGLKALFDAQRRSDVGEIGSGLEELPVEGFDTEQLWAMISMENEPVLEHVQAKVSLLAKLGEFPLYEQDEESSEEEQEDLKSSDEEEEEEEEEKEEYESEREENVDESSSELEEREDEEGEEIEAEEEEEDDDDDDGDGDAEKEMDDKIGPTEMDDEFFKFSDMEKYVQSVEQDDIEMKLMLEEKKQAQEKNGAKNKFLGNDDDYSDDGEEELDEEDELEEPSEDDLDVSSDEEGQNYTYADLWGNAKDEESKTSSKRNKKAKKSRLEDSQTLSTFEKKQQEILEQIEELEEEALQEKPWELRGETHAYARPKNSLLEKGDLDVDYLSRPAPTVTEESTQSLEDKIRQRILDSDFDDVERKLPMALDADYKPQMELSVEKSKLGLAEEYAKEYEQQVLGHTPDQVLERTKEQEEIHQMFMQLCSKLDALTNFHYTPKPPSMEGTIKPLANVAAIEMEEALPVYQSVADQAAPEEVLAKKKGKEGVGKTVEEMDQAERKRLRQSKKAEKRSRKRQRDAEKKIVSRLNPGLGNKHAKTAVLNSHGAADGVNWTKSSDFFKRLQNAQENPNQAAAKTARATASLDASSSSASAAALRL